MDDIYRNLSLESFPNLSKPALKRLELEVERENLSPVRQALDLIRNYRKKGKRILFISDMYLPSDFLKSQLRRFGFWEEEDRIYVSGEIGLTKHSGNLFRYIQREERILRCSWIHVGIIHIAIIMYLSLCLYGQGGFIILIPLSRICGRMICGLPIRNSCFLFVGIGSGLSIVPSRFGSFGFFRGRVVGSLFLVCV